MVIDIHMKKEEIMKILVRVNRLLLVENATYEGSEGFGSDILRGLLTDYCSGKFILWPRTPFSDAS